MGNPVEGTQSGLEKEGIIEWHEAESKIQVLGKGPGTFGFWGKPLGSMKSLYSQNANEQILF